MSAKVIVQAYIMSALHMLKTGQAAAAGHNRPARTSRSHRLVVRAADDGFCRDKVNLAKAPFKSEGKVYKLSFLGVGDQKMVVECPDDSYILDAAEQAGLDLPATCRGGICGACVGRIAKGTVDQSDIDDLSFTVTEEEQAQGMALLCMSRATSDCEIETQCDWGYSLGVKEWTGATGRFSAAPDPLMGESWQEAKSR